MAEWLCIIRPPRPAFVEDMSPAEAELMESHFAYLKGLLEAEKLILAGPSLDRPSFGVIVLEAESEEEARRLVEADPSIAAGLQTPELHPFRASLLRGR